jgi:hypothetical protein
MKMTTTTKYGKYILTPSEKVEAGPALAGVITVPMQGLNDWGGIKHRMYWSIVTAAVVMVDKPHSHKFDEIVGFYSCDPAHELDFTAEIELSLGREGEKQVIDSPSVVCIPKGLEHGPLNFKKISRPVLFWRIYISPEYERIPVV